MKTRYKDYPEFLELIEKFAQSYNKVKIKSTSKLDRIHKTLSYLSETEKRDIQKLLFHDLKFTAQ